MSAPTGSSERRQQDLHMMQNPENWPMWPILPLKRPGYVADNDGIGVLVAWEGHLTEVFYTSMFGIKGKGNGTIREAFADVPSKQYTDFDAILDDGWTVD